MSGCVGCDGFDMYNGTGANTGLQSKWTLTGAGGYSLVAGRFGGQAMRLNSTAGSSCQANRPLPGGGSYSSFTYKFAFRSATLASIVGICVFQETAATHCGIDLNADGSLSVGRFTAAFTRTVLATSAASIIAANTWHGIVVEVVISDTVGRMTVYVDGVQVINLTGADTRNGATGVVDRVRHQQNNGVSINNDHDDICVYDAATGFSAERKVETIRASADTAQKDWTASTGTNNAAMVDETLVNGDTDYVQASTVGNRDLYSNLGLGSTPAAIDGVQVVMFAEKTDAATRSIYGSVQSAGTDSDGAAMALAASYSRFERAMMQTDPATSAAWIASGVNNLLFGPKVAA